MTGKVPKKLDREGMDRYGRSPLHYACLEGNLDEVKQRIADGALINMQDDNGLTPLCFAVQDKRYEIIRLLLSLEADTNLLDAHGNGVLWAATIGTKKNTFTEDLTIINLLLLHGANPHQLNKYDNSPYKLANEIANGMEIPFEKFKL